MWQFADLGFEDPIFLYDFRTQLNQMCIGTKIISANNATAEFLLLLQWEWPTRDRIVMFNPHCPIVKH